MKNVENKGTGKKNRCYHIILMLVLIMITITNVCGCGDKDDDRETISMVVNKNDDKLHIGFSMATLKEDRWLKDQKIFVALAEQQGIKVTVKNANNSSHTQYMQVRELIQAGIDVLVIIPTDCDGNDARECVRIAIDNNVKVVYYDRFITNAGSDNAKNIYVAFDHEKAGKMVASYITEEVSKGGYIAINGPKNDYSSRLFEKGYLSVIQPFIDKGDITLLGEHWTEDWLKEDAASFVKNIASSDKDKINAVISANDAMAGSALESLSISRVDTSNLKITGQDADLDSCKRIVNGKQLLTVYKPVQQLAKTAIDVCKKLYNGEEVKGTDGRVMNDGTFNIPFVKVDVNVVTKDNIDETIIKDGFHVKAAIYDK